MAEAVMMMMMNEISVAKAGCTYTAGCPRVGAFWPGLWLCVRSATVCVSWVLYGRVGREWV